MDKTENWFIELWDSVCQGPSELIIIFNSKGEVLKKNKIYDQLIVTDFPSAFTNPSFESIVQSKLPDGLIFRGYITFNNEQEFNISLHSSIYRKGEEFFLCGGIDFMETLSQSKMYYELNREITSLQRTLLKEKTVLEQTKRELQKLNKDLFEANLTKDKFFSIIAHDLRSPFHGLIGMSEILSDKESGLSTDEQTKYAEMIKKSAKSIYELLENLLLWANFQKGTISFQPVEVNLTQLVSTVLEQLQSSFLQKEITVKNNVPGNLAGYCDENMIKTVVRNLLTNAVKFSTRESEIILSGQNLQNSVSIAVQDHGFGMSSEEVDKLFRMDVKLSKKGTEGESSTGLGLILCKEFIDKNNGEISVSSEPGVGSVFTISLPKPI